MRPSFQISRIILPSVQFGPCIPSFPIFLSRSSTSVPPVRSVSIYSGRLRIVPKPFRVVHPHPSVRAVQSHPSIQFSCMTSTLRTIPKPFQAVHPHPSVQAVRLYASHMRLSFQISHIIILSVQERSLNRSKTVPRYSSISFHFGSSGVRNVRERGSKDEV